MSVATLKYEAGIWLSHIHGRFVAATAGRNVEYPLTDVIACRAFAACVTETMDRFRSADARLPPMALILTMITVCDEIANPTAETRATHDVPRAFAYEMFDRLRAEVPVTYDFALDQVGRIITEAGTQSDATKVRRAYLTFRRRIEGAFEETELVALVGSVWESRFPASRHLLDDHARHAA